LYENTKSRSRFRRSKSNITFQEVLLKLRDKLSSDGYTQIPQLTSSRPLDIQDTSFQLSSAQGKKRAVLVGINYKGTNGELSGCINDVYNMKQYIQNVHGFPEEDIVVVVDDGSSNNYPMRSRIIQALKGLVSKSKAGDAVFFHYSGMCGHSFSFRNAHFHV